HRFRGMVVGECADTRSLSRKLELRIALGEPRLGQLALRIVNAHADDTMGTSLAVIGNKTACLDPANPAVRTNDAIFNALLAPPLVERFATRKDCSFYVLWVHRGEALAPGNLGRPLRKAMDGRIAL